MLKLTINIKLIVPCVWNLKKNYPKLRSPVPPMVVSVTFRGDRTPQNTVVVFPIVEKDNMGLLPHSLRICYSPIIFYWLGLMFH